MEIVTSRHTYKRRTEPRTVINNDSEITDHREKLMAKMVDVTKEFNSMMKESPLPDAEKAQVKKHFLSKLKSQMKFLLKRETQLAETIG